MGMNMRLIALALLASSLCACAGAIPVADQRHFDTAEAIFLARGVGRGRRSSVGIHGFSGGGLIVEAGKYAPRPSAASEAEAGGSSHEVSPLVARVHLPAEWRCVVIIQRDAEGLHGEAEKAAFADLPPVERALSAELARIALMELVPAALEGKFAEFSAAVGRYGQLAGLPFASHTAGLPQTESTRQLLELLAELGFCTALLVLGRSRLDLAHLRTLAFLTDLVKVPLYRHLESA